jgi:fatty-acyl-CoA synthase
MMAGSTCPPDLLENCVNLLNLDKMTVAYGMTETAPISFAHSVDDPVEQRTANIGTIMPYTECKIVETEWDDEEGELVATDPPRTTPIGQKGELWIRGHGVMLGYWNDPVKTAKFITPDGWAKTGDIGAIDEDGYCKILSRLKDVLIRGGENIYPSEIEEVLRLHPDIHDA